MFKLSKVVAYITITLLCVAFTNTYAKNNRKSSKQTSKAIQAALQDVSSGNHQSAGNIASSYRVWGKRYYVLSSAKDYQQTGIASWYGGSFNGRHTSSGERYNMYKMTAAHKSLPLSTYVLVKNLRNGKSVVVKINDRGPFVSNRIIDLSYGAAKKIGMVGQGIAKVSVRTIQV